MRFKNTALRCTACLAASSFFVSSAFADFAPNTKADISGAAIPQFKGLVVRPSMAMVSPLGWSIGNSPAGFSIKREKDATKKSPAPKKRAKKVAPKPPVKPPATQLAKPPVLTQPAPAAPEQKHHWQRKRQRHHVEPAVKHLVTDHQHTQVDLHQLSKPTTRWHYTAHPKKAVHVKRTYCPLVSVSLGFGAQRTLGGSQFFAPGASGTTSFYSFSDHTRSQSQTVYGFFAGYEWLLLERFSLQTGLGYYQSGTFVAGGNLNQGVTAPTSVTFPYHYHVSSQRWLLEAKLLYNQRRFHPYLMAGLGVAVNKASGYETGAGATTTYAFGNNSVNSFTYSLGLGVDYDAAKNVRLGLGYRFSDYGRYKLKSGTVGAVSTANKLSQAHVYVNEILGQFSLFF